MESGNDAHIVTDPVTSAACPKCGAMLDVEGLPAFTQVQCPTCEFEFQVPARFGSFMLLQLLGAGGMGGVYRARDESLNREVAIKVLLKSLGDDPQFVETFQREAQAAARLNHPHIAQIYSFGQVHGQPYIAMELVSGGSLDKMMSTQGPLDPAAAIHIGAEIADGLREAADAGLVHGDVKPENILFDNEKNAKLVDFGLAALQGGPGNDVWGTPFYIAPEKVRRQKSDFRSDIYSLGATLYHAIAGVPPFDGPDATAVVKARFDGPPKTLKELRGNAIPPEVDSLISRMLAVEPQTRYPTYGSLLGDMRRYLSKAGPIQLATSSKKIMIRGKTPKNTTGVATTTGTLGETPSSGIVSAGAVPDGMIPVDQIVEEPETEEAASKRGSKMIALLVGGILLLVVLVGAGIWGGMAYTASKKSAAEHARLEKSQDSARTSITKSVSNARMLVERVRAYVPEAMGYAKSAADEVVAVLGETVKGAMIPPEPDYAALTKSAAEPTAAATATTVSNAAAATATVAKAAASGTSNGVATALSNTVANALAKGDAAAVSNAVVDALSKGGVAAVSNAVSAALGGVPPQTVANALTALAAAAPAATASAGEDQHPVVAIVRSMFEDAYAVKAASAIADQLLADVEAKAKAAETLTALDQTEALVKTANAIVEKVNNLSYTREISEVPRKVSRLKKTLAGVKTDIASLVAMKKQEALDKAKKEKEAAVAEKKHQEMEALKEKAQNEVARVTATEETNLALLKQLQFRDAGRALKDLTDDLETKSGLDALATAQERVTRLEAFHKYLVDKAVGYKSSRGWSIEAADAKTLTVANKKIAWVDVFGSRPEIVAELINGLVMDDQATKNMRLREKTTLMTNAALCLSLFYKDMPSAVERAKQLAVKAAQDFDADADVIKRLLPTFFTE